MLRAALHDCIQLVERIVTAILQIGDAPDASPALLTTLVAAIPVAIRTASLREELSNEDEGFARRAVEALVSRLRACLDRHPTHGRGCAVVTLWTAYCRQAQATRESEKFTRPTTELPPSLNVNWNGSIGSGLTQDAEAESIEEGYARWWTRRCVVRTRRSRRLVSTQGRRMLSGDQYCRSSTPSDPRIIISIPEKSADILASKIRERRYSFEHIPHRFGGVVRGLPRGP